MVLAECKLGANVKLGEGPLMTITALLTKENKNQTMSMMFEALESQSGGSDGYAQCTWFNKNNEILRDWFPVESLTAVDD